MCAAKYSSFDSMDTVGEGTEVEEVARNIFQSCDEAKTGLVHVSKLIEYITPYMHQNDEELIELRRSLDPENTDVEVDSDTFQTVMANWRMKFLEDPCEAGDALPTICSKDLDHIADKDLPFVPENVRNSFGYYFFKEKDNDGLFKFTSSSPYCIKDNSGDIIEAKIMEDKIEELEKTNSHLKEEIRILKSQILHTEQQNDSLQIEFKEYRVDCEKTIEKWQKNFMSVEKENKNLKEQISTIQATNYEFENKLQQSLKKESERMLAFSEIQKELAVKDREIGKLEQANEKLMAQLFEQQSSLNHYQNDNEWLKTEKNKLEGIVYSPRLYQSQSKPSTGTFQSPNSLASKLLERSLMKTSYKVFYSPTLHNMLDNPISPLTTPPPSKSPDGFTDCNLSSPQLYKSIVDSTIPDPIQALANSPIVETHEQDSPFASSTRKTALTLSNLAESALYSSEDDELDWKYIVSPDRDDHESLHSEISQAASETPAEKYELILEEYVKKIKQLENEISINKTQQFIDEGNRNSLISRLAELESELKDKDERLQELLNDFENLEKKLEEVQCKQNEHIKLRESMQEIQIERDNVKRELEEQTKKFEELNIEMINISMQTDEEFVLKLATLEEENDILTNKLTEVLQKYEDLDRNSNTLKKELSEKESKFEIELTKYTYEIDQLRLEKEQLSTEYQSQMDNYRQEMINLEEELELKRKQIIKLANSLTYESVEDLQKSIQKLTDERENLLSANRDLNANFERIVEERAAIETELKSAQNRVEQLDEQLQKLSTDNAVLKSKGEYESSKEVRAILEHDFFSIDTQSSASTISLGCNNCGNMKTEIERLKSRIQILHGRLVGGDKPTTFNKSQVAIEKLRTRNEDLLERQNMQAEQILKLSGELQLVLKEKGGLENRLCISNNQVEQLQDELHKSVESKETELETMRQEKLQFIEEISRLVSQRDKLERTLEKSKRDYKQKLTEAEAHIQLHGDKITKCKQVLKLLEDKKIAVKDLTNCLTSTEEELGKTQEKLDNLNNYIENTKVWMEENKYHLCRATRYLVTCWHVTFEKLPVKNLLQEDLNNSMPNSPFKGIEGPLDVEIREFTHQVTVTIHLLDTLSALQPLHPAFVDEEAKLMFTSNDTEGLPVIENSGDKENFLEITNNNEIFTTTADQSVCGLISNNSPRMPKTSKSKLDLNEIETEEVPLNECDKENPKDTTNCEETHQESNQNIKSTNTLRKKMRSIRTTFRGVNQKYKIVWWCGAISLFAMGCFCLGVIFIFYILYDKNGFFSPLDPREWIRIDELLPPFFTHYYKGTPPV